MTLYIIMMENKSVKTEVTVQLTFFSTNYYTISVQLMKLLHDFSTTYEIIT